MRTRNSKFKLISFFSAIIIFLVSIELFSYLYIKIFLNQSKTEFAENLRNQEPPSSMSEYTPHPNFTYVSQSPLSNNMGFVSKFNYPYERKENDFVIGLFGGSVADMMSWKSDFFKATDLIKKHIPALKNKNVVLLNFATGCAKQPMQYHRFSRFAEDIDMAINIDGFNEVEFNFIGADITAPCMMADLYEHHSYEPSVNLVMKIFMAQSKFLKNKMFSSSLYEKSAAFTLSTKLIVKLRNHVQYNLVGENYAFISTGKSKLYPFDFKTDTRDLYFLGAKAWAKYTRLQLAVAKELNKPILFVLQPNILFKGTKPISAEEQLLDETMLEGGGTRWSEKSENVTRGYKELQTQLGIMKKNSPHNFVDLTGIFSQKTQTIYSDPCCHYNEEGNTLLWTEVAKAASRIVK